jgi:hypothetical protein
LFQKAIPRGLTYIFKRTQHAPVLKYVNIVFPTSKFFGDNDVGEEVEIMTPSTIDNMQQGASTYIVTEKINGEMFTFTPIEKIDNNNEWIIAAGSKNNKFLFHVNTGTIKTDAFMESIEYIVQTQLKTEGKGGKLIENLSSSEWTNTNMWAEMCISIFRKLSVIMSTEAMEAFLDEMYERKETLCGEYLSYLHPHIVEIPLCYRDCIFFAVTTYDEQTFYSIRPDARNNLARLKFIAEKYGISIISFYETHETLSDLRKKIMKQRKTEGVVLIKCNENGKMEERIKLKTLWYVVHRGIREKLRKFITDANKNHINGRIDVIFLGKILMKTLKSKLEIFSLNTDSIEAQEYVTYINRLSIYVAQESRKDLAKLTKTFMYNYPLLVSAAVM